jgi:hypothetical protein
LASYRGRSAVVGWRLPFDDGTRRLDVIIPDGFQSSPARIALVDRPPFMTWPHVEEDGVLCLVPDYTTFSVDQPGDGVVWLLHEAVALIAASIRGEMDEDFRSEFLTYWQRAERRPARTILSLIEPSSPSRRVTIWSDSKRTIIAENEDQLRDWLRNFTPAVSRSFIKPIPGVFAWLDAVMLPKIIDRKLPGRQRGAGDPCHLVFKPRFPEFALFAVMKVEATGNVVPLWASHAPCPQSIEVGGHRRRVTNLERPVVGPTSGQQMFSTARGIGSRASGKTASHRRRRRSRSQGTA